MRVNPTRPAITSARKKTTWVRFSSLTSFATSRRTPALQERGESGWLAAEDPPAGTPAATQGPGLWGFPAVSPSHPSHPSTFPHCERRRIAVEFSADPPSFHRHAGKSDRLCCQGVVPLLVAVLILIRSASSAAEPLQGVLHLRVGNPNDPDRRNLRLDRPGVLPLKTGDRFWIEARINRTAYLYLFWIGSDGKVAPIYPWHRGRWEERPAEERKRDRLDLPPEADKAWEIPAGRPGIETLLLLVREDSPLPRKDEETIANLLVGVRVSPDKLIKAAVWVENGREVTIDRHDRAAPSSKSRKSDDRVLRIRRILQEKVQPLGDYHQAIVFPNQGGK